MAHFTCLAAARHAVLRDAGWDVEAEGLQGAPEVRVIAPEQAHVTVKVACRMLGLGAERGAQRRHGRPGPDARRCPPRRARRYDGPAIVCAQAGEINTGAFDPFAEIVDACRARGAWCHVDGAFGLWAAVSPTRGGCSRATTSGLVGDRRPQVAERPVRLRHRGGGRSAAHRAAMTSTSAYIPSHDDDVPWGFDWTPEFSRRARGVPVYAALRSLGRAGVADLIDRCCDHAARMAARLAAAPGVEVLERRGWC